VFVAPGTPPEQGVPEGSRKTKYFPTADPFLGEILFPIHHQGLESLENRIKRHAREVQ